MATNNGAGGHRVMIVRYMECQRNLSAHSAAYAADGCRAFEKSGPMGTPEFMICATCGCNRNFHRKEELPPQPAADHHSLLRRLAATASAPLPPLPPRPPRRPPAAAQPSPLPPQPQPPVAPEIMEENKPLKKRKTSMEAGEASSRPSERV
ncbi:zinc-finger homeodomain protein 1-like [Actinidia eriantha]|uniref:zinc-finger homeodomain protein 1-like n=1 Tax=Actinidia eriantha TaxID=165200 RepID=UPI002585FA16|nr:zinc-finger homeodomain protein 1-like [Actinidia eriantha]